MRWPLLPSALALLGLAAVLAASSPAAADTVFEEPGHPLLARSGASLAWSGTHAYLFGGQVNGTYSDAILRYTPSTGEVVEMPTRLPWGRMGTAAVWDGRDRPSAGCPGGCAYVFGGVGSVVASDLSTSYRHVLRYNPATGALTSLGELLPSGRLGMSAVWDPRDLPGLGCAGGCAYLFGGNVDTSCCTKGPSNQIVRFSPTTNTATVLTAALPSPRIYTSASWGGTFAYVLGGSPQTDVDVLRFDPVGGTVQTSSQVLHAERVTAVATPHEVYVFGGIEGSTVVSDIQRYDPAANRLITKPTALPAPRAGALGFWDGEDAIVVGGTDAQGNLLASVLRYSTEPAEPWDFVAFPLYPGDTVYLRWRAPAADTFEGPLQGFHLYRGTSPDALSLLATVNASTLSYQHPGNPWGTTVYFAVAAVSRDGEGALTVPKAVEIPPLPSPPPGLQGTFAPAAADLTLTWDAFVRGSQDPPALAYRVYRSVNSGPFERIAETDSWTRLWGDDDLLPGATYQYRVSTVNVRGEGPPSDPITLVAPPVPTPPREVLASRGTEPGTLRLAWAPPTDPGTGGLTGYAVHADPALRFAADDGTMEYVLSVDGTDPAMEKRFFLPAGSLAGLRSATFEVLAAAPLEPCRTPANVGVAWSVNGLVLKNFTSCDHWGTDLAWRSFRVPPETLREGEVNVFRLDGTGEWLDTSFRLGIDHASNFNQSTLVREHVVCVFLCITIRVPYEGEMLARLRLERDPGPPLASAAQEAEALVLTGLPANSTHRLVVTALNAAGRSAASAVTVATTPAPPEPPRNLAAATGPGAGEVSLSWSLGDHGGLPVSALEVTRSQVLEASRHVHDDGTAEADHLVGTAGYSAQKRFTVDAAAFTTATEARLHVYGKAVGCGIKATSQRLSLNSASVLEFNPCLLFPWDTYGWQTFQVPASRLVHGENGFAITSTDTTRGSLDLHVGVDLNTNAGRSELRYHSTSYPGELLWRLETVTRATPATAFEAPPSGPLVDGGLPPGTRYEYTLRALNGVGVSPPAAAPFVSTFAVPAPPSLVTAVAGPAPGHVRLSWSASPDPEGAPVTGYRLLARVGEGPEALVAVLDRAARNLTHAALPEGATVTYRVAAINLAGEGAPSATASAVVWRRPDAPPAPVPTRGPGLGSIQLTWSSPAADGGTPVLGYVLLRDGAVIQETASLAFQDSGLADATTHEYAVAAVNAVGQGPASPVASVTTYPRVAPAVPLNLAASPEAGIVSLTWRQPPDNGGQPPTGYVLYRGEGTAPLAPVASLQAPLFLDSGLAFSTPYRYAVAAVNDAGEGEPTAPVTVTTFNAQPPGHPRGAAATPGPQEGTIQVTWSAPAEDGSAPPATYRLYRSRDGGPSSLVATVPGTSAAYVDGGLVGQARYTYHLTGVNSRGEGPASDPASALPRTQPLTPAFTGAAAVNVNGIVFAFGGETAQDVKLDQIARYDPATGAAGTMVSRLPSARAYAAAVWTGTHVYLFGGRTATMDITEVLRYDPGNDTLTMLSVKSPDAYHKRAVAWDGKAVYLIGGLSVSGATGSAISRFTPATGAFDRPPGWASFPHNHGATAVAAGGKIYVIGGCWPGLAVCNRIQSYDPRTGGNALEDTLVEAREGAVAYYDGDHVIIAGGRSGATLRTSIEKFNPATGSATRMAHTLSEPRAYAGAVFDGARLLLMGGAGCGGVCGGLSEFRVTPGAPEALVAAPVGSGTVQLAWTAPPSNTVSKVTHYRVYRLTPDGTETLLATLGPVTTYLDAAAGPTGLYRYRVAAVDHGVNEGAKAEAVVLVVRA